MTYAILVIDDDRTFDPARLDIRDGDVLIHARTAREGLRRLTERSYDELWLDHDLADGQDIDPVLAYLEREIAEGRKVEFDRVVVHSGNPEGARKIRAALERHYRVERLTDPRPFMVQKRGR